jgi:hypothetical protein
VNAISTPEATAIAATFTDGNPAPYDVEAGRERIRLDRLAATARADMFNKAVRELSKLVRTEADIVRVLHAVSNSVNEYAKPLATTDLADSVKWVEQLADRIEFRNEDLPEAADYVGSRCVGELDAQAPRSNAATIGEQL